MVRFLYDDGPKEALCGVRGEEMTDLLCVHKPIYLDGWDKQSNVPLHYCVRCDETWKFGDKEPEVVIGRLRPSPG